MCDGALFGELTQDDCSGQQHEDAQRRTLIFSSADAPLIFDYEEDSGEDMGSHTSEYRTSAPFLEAG